MKKHLGFIVSIMVIAICSMFNAANFAEVKAAPLEETFKPDIDHPLYEFDYENNEIKGIYKEQVVEDFLIDFSDDFKISMWNGENELYEGPIEIGMYVKVKFQEQDLGEFSVKEWLEVSERPASRAANKFGFTSMFHGKDPLKFVSSEFGERWGKPHKGIDITWSGIRGTKIRAVKAGKVIEAYEHPDWGNTVLIDHGDKIYTRYAHMVEAPEVKVNQSVDQYSILGGVGTTGNSTGDHLHFEVYVGSTHPDARVNPRKYLEGAGDPVKNGWATEGGNKYYYVNGQKTKGEKAISGYWYYFHASTGAMQTGFVQIPNKDKKCYYNSAGQMQYGELSTGGYWYYLHPSTGAVQIGFVDVPVKSGGKKKCYYDNDGRMTKGEKAIGGNWYYFHESTGAMQTGFVDVPEKNGGKKKCYYDTEGRMVKGEKAVGGYWYYFHASTGAMQTGFVDVPVKSGGKKKCYYDTEGRMVKGEKAIGGYWYYFHASTGAMQTGWVEQGGKICYYNATGQMQYGEQKIDGYWYYFHATRGGMQTGFVEVPNKNKTCYYNSEGKMQYGELEIGGSRYYFASVTGALTIGWRTEGTTSYYYHSDGKQALGSQTIDGNEYYFDKTDGKMIINDWAEGNYYGPDGIKVNQLDELDVLDESEELEELDEFFTTES